MPAPWLSRDDLMDWIRNNLKASPDLNTGDRHRLLVMLDMLKALDPDDTKAVEAWRDIQRLAPKVWERAKPVLDRLIGEAVKRLLGL